MASSQTCHSPHSQVDGRRWERSTTQVHCGLGRMEEEGFFFFFFHGDYEQAQLCRSALNTSFKNVFGLFHSILEL